MIIYPAIDLYQGKCVRLYQGKFDNAVIYDADPIAVAKKMEQESATVLHVVDLEGAKATKPVQTDLINQMICSTNLAVQVGGGIRESFHIQQLLDQGASRVVIGSVAISKSVEVKQWIKHYGVSKIVLALDVYINEHEQPMVATNAWQQSSQKTLWDVLDDYQTVDIQQVLCTDISRDGTLQGPNLSLYQTCVMRYPDIKFQASGGIGSLEDLTALSKISIAGVVIGKALYKNKFTLKTALAVIPKSDFFVVSS